MSTLSCDWKIPDSKQQSSNMFANGKYFEMIVYLFGQNCSTDQCIDTSSRLSVKRAYISNWNHWLDMLSAFLWPDTDKKTKTP